MKLFSHKYVGIIPSWSCDGRCRHCYIPAAWRQADDFQEEEIKRLILGLPREIRVIAFSGGEPFLHPDRLLSLLSVCRDAGRVATVVTSGRFVRDFSSVKRLLRKCYRLGLRGISVSLDEYHRPQISTRAMYWLVSLSREIGIDVQVRLSGQRASGLLKMFQDKSSIYFPDYLIREQNIVRLGTAKKINKDSLARESATWCPAVLEPAVFPDGRVLACHSMWAEKITSRILWRGNAFRQPIQRILRDATEDFSLAFIAVFGPAGVARLLGKRSKQVVRSRCEYCINLLSQESNELNVVNTVNQCLDIRKAVVGRMILYERLYQPTWLESFIPFV
jgi:hypothetical protein